VAVGDLRLSRGKSTRGRFTARRKRSFRLKLLAVFLTLILLSCLYIWQRVTVITLSAGNKELKLEIKQKHKTRKYLQIEVARLSSVGRVEKLGKKMGFAYPSPGQTGLIRESSDSTYLEMPGLAKNIWTKLKTFQKDLLSVRDEAFAKEMSREP
jgi:cell division protein FtsL